MWQRSSFYGYPHLKVKSLKYYNVSKQETNLTLSSLVFIVSNTCGGVTTTGCGVGVAAGVGAPLPPPSSTPPVLLSLTLSGGFDSA